MRLSVPALALLAMLSPGAFAAPSLELAETVPAGTTLDDPTIPDAQQAWLELIGSATTRIDISQFYLAPGPDGASRLQPVLELIEKKAKKGVNVRFLIDANFRASDWDAIKKLEGTKNIDVMRFDLKAITGGVQHAKYFLVDGTAAWIGSQNFDWRSLEHVQELGFTLREPTAVADLQKVFELDWALASGQTPAAASRDVPPPAQPPTTVGSYGDQDITLALVASPDSLLPPGVRWDLPLILDAIDKADKSVRVQIMSYAIVGYDKSYWDDLDRALRRAAARGVDVELLVADWSMSKKSQPVLKSLAVMPHLTVKFMAIPQPEGTFIEYGRVVHAKYMVVDGHFSWVGTSNWSRDYFASSRNVGIVVEGASLATKLDGWFEHNWTSEYAELVRPGRRYHAPPRTARDLERERNRPKPGVDNGDDDDE